MVESPQPICSIHLDDVTAARVRKNAHTSLLVERRQSDEANQCMGMIRRPWWSKENLGQSGQRLKKIYLSHKKKIRTKIQITNTHNIQVKHTVLYFHVQ